MRRNPLVASRKDKAWQEKIEKKLKTEKINLDHPKGREQFTEVIKNALKKK